VTFGRSREPSFVAIDVATSGARACAVDLTGRVVEEARRLYPTATPRAGWAEQDPSDWVARSSEALAQLHETVSGRYRVEAITLTGMSPTVAPVDGDGVAVGPGMLYRDNRAAGHAERLRKTLGADRVQQRTGHVPTAFHVAPKIMWLRDRAPEQFHRAALFVQPKDLVLHHITGTWLTDETHANSTLVYDLRQRAWAPDLLEACDLTESQFPAVGSSLTVVGGVARHLGLPVDCPVILGGADSQCAAYGSSVVDPGPVSEMAGSSSCINSAVIEPLADHTIMHYSHVVPGRFTTELGINTTGIAVTWVMDRLGFSGYDEFEAAAAAVSARLRAGLDQPPQAIAPLFFPILGDGDRRDARLRGGFVGLSDRHDRAALAYAVLEGIAFSVADALAVLASAGTPVSELRVAGGLARLAELGKIKADALGLPVRHLLDDTAAVGAALLGAGATGFAQDAGEAIRLGLSKASLYEPSTTAHRYLAERREWFDSVLRSGGLLAQEAEAYE
jgi:xylulokinase